jgi:DNA-binding HxlR family transcriptional regulator
MALIDLIGRRWVLRIIWELRAKPLTFRALQDACGGVSPSVMNQRLAELRETGLIHGESEHGYALTGLGRELLRLLVPLTVWAEKWAKAAAIPLPDETEAVSSQTTRRRKTSPE